MTMSHCAAAATRCLFQFLPSQSATQAVNILLLVQVATGVSRGLAPQPGDSEIRQRSVFQYLKTMPAGTQVAVMGWLWTAVGCIWCMGFTSDRNLLVAAVNSIAYQLVPDSYWDPAYPPRWLLLCKCTELSERTGGSMP